MQSPQTSHNDGFTLVELLIVIVILGILSTVTVFAVSGLTDAANAVSRFNMSLLVPATYVMTNPGDSLAYLQGQGYVNP